MKWQGLNELREKYLSFFESKNHTRLPSFSLIPQGDKSLLLINSGMAPLKKYFLGQAVPPNVRVTTCQKCIRTPDIERVGQTARHGTYFEMLGNFSFGDYFKQQAIEWAWEFFTKELEMPVDKLYVSVFENDDEAYDLWTKHIGVEPSHMKRLGREDNFWEHGSGPCGPCSEIYFDRGEEKGCGKPTCGVGCDCDRYVEVWNLVFSQFNSDGNGHYTEMEHKNIDTGMGLERLACIMQGVDNLFEVDTVQNIMKHVCKIANVAYHTDDKTDVALRVITDHIRSTTFMIGDGVMPSNAGRGYVLRRLLRRAARYGRLIGIEKPFLYEVCDTVIAENRVAYPELEEKKAYIRKIVQVEEETFAKTVDNGMAMLNQILEQIDQKEISGEDAFKLSDTYGFPIDLTMEIAAEQGVSVDREGFDALVKAQREKSQADHLAKAGSSWAGNSIRIAGEKTVFTGYEHLTETDAKIIAIYKEQDAVDVAVEGDTVVIVLDKTPFYAESGGQVGDCGTISTASCTATVSSTSKNEDGHYLHIATVEDGDLHVGDVVTAAVAEEVRRATMRNHTAAHLLQAALREVLGDHVHQAGQLVTPQSCRFDFSHFSAMTKEEIQKVEQLVNEKILAAIPVTTESLPIAEARKRGAMALFGEKYGERVRVIQFGSSIEFCGGIHVAATGNIGMVKIISESSVAAGVRRIEAYTGARVEEMLDTIQDTISELKSLFNNAPDLGIAIRKYIEENAGLKKQVEDYMKEKEASLKERLLKNIQEIHGIKVIKFCAPLPAEVVKNIAFQLRGEITENLFFVAGSLDNGKPMLTVMLSDNLVAGGLKAGNLVKEAAKLIQGGGGGQPHFATAGGKNTDGLNAAIEKVLELAGI